MFKFKSILIITLLSAALCLRIHIQSSVTYDSLKTSLGQTIDYKYYDNLGASGANYYYGTITKQAYEMSVKLYKMDDYEQCNSATPYATKDMQSCMKCPSDRPLFDLGTRECEPCKPHITKKCDALFNITTPSLSDSTTSTNNNTINTTSAPSNTPTFSSTTSNITATPTTKPTGYTPLVRPAANTTSPSATTSNTTDSTVDSPFVVVWQPKPKVQPVQNQPNQSLSTETNDFVLEPVAVSNDTDSLHQNYTIEYRVVQNKTNTTSLNATTTTLIAESQKENATFFSQECPPLTPYYNPSTKTCQNCKENEEYVSLRKKCLPIIYTSNPKTKYVILNSPDQLLQANLNISKANPERTVRVCPIDRPLAVNNLCMACPADKIFNFTKQECQEGCPDGQIFSQANSKCIDAKFLTNSDAPNLLSPLRDFQAFRAGQKQRIKASATTAECPLGKPVILNGVCSNCPSETPLYNIQSQACQNCSRNRFYNTYSRKCESVYDSGLQVKRVVPNIF